jgi:hypothetical protein
MFVSKLIQRELIALYFMSFTLRPYATAIRALQAGYLHNTCSKPLSRQAKDSNKVLMNCTRYSPFGLQHRR